MALDSELRFLYLGFLVCYSEVQGTWSLFSVTRVEQGGEGGCEIASVITLEEPLAKMAYEFLLYVLASSSFEREQALSCRDHLRHTTHIHIQVLDLQPAQRELPSQRTRNLRPHAGPVAALRPCFGSGTQFPSVLRQAPLSSVPVKVRSIAVYCCD